MCQQPDTRDNLVWGCADDQDGAFDIFVDQALKGDDLACVVAHEKAHMPPNKGRHKAFTTTPGSAFRRLIHYQIWLHWT